MFQKPQGTYTERMIMKYKDNEEKLPSYYSKDNRATINETRSKATFLSGNF